MEFRDYFKDFLVLNQQEIKNLDPQFNVDLLYQWQKKNYIKKVCKGYYIFSDLELNEMLLFYIANKIYEPSYISLEHALSYYNLIPESVYGITSISTKKTQVIKSSIADFYFNNLKTDLFWGYSGVAYKKIVIKIADMEKCVLDYFKLKSHIRTKEQIQCLRIDAERFTELLDHNKFYTYLEAFKNKSLEKRISTFIEVIKND